MQSLCDNNEAELRINFWEKNIYRRAVGGTLSIFFQIQSKMWVVCRFRFKEDTDFRDKGSYLYWCSRLQSLELYSNARFCEQDA